MRHAIGCLVLFTSLALSGCEKSDDKSKPPATKPATAAKQADDHKHTPGDGHDHSADDGHGHKDEAKGHSGHGGEVIELGTTKIGDSTVRAARDKGEIKPGGDAPIDVWIDGGLGTGVTAVRFWIGTQDAKGSIKAKAEAEEAKWHTHTEVPDPLPTGSQLWVEIEAGGKKAVGSFNLKS